MGNRAKKKRERDTHTHRVERELTIDQQSPTEY